MRRSRPTIAALMGVVGLAAIGFGALRYPSWLAANLVFTLALAVHLSSLVALANIRGPGRSFWRGFAIFGWGYMLLSVAPGSETTTSPRLATTILIDLAFEHCYTGPYPQLYTRDAPVHAVGMDKVKLWTWPEPIMTVRNSSFYVMSPDAFLLIGHSLFSLPIAMAGGLLGRSLARRTAAEGPAESPPSPPEGP